MSCKTVLQKFIKWALFDSVSPVSDNFNTITETNYSKTLFFKFTKCNVQKFSCKNTMEHHGLKWIIFPHSFLWQKEASLWSDCMCALFYPTSKVPSTQGVLSGGKLLYKRHIKPCGFVVWWYTAPSSHPNTQYTSTINPVSHATSRSNHTQGSKDTKVFFTAENMAFT